MSFMKSSKFEMDAKSSIDLSQTHYSGSENKLENMKKKVTRLWFSYRTNVYRRRIRKD